MPVHKSLLWIVCSIALFFHAGGIYLCHRLPMSSNWISLRRPSSFMTATFQEKKDRNELLREIFHSITETPSIKKQSLPDLAPEILSDEAFVVSPGKNIDTAFSIPPSFPSLPDLLEDENGDLCSTENKEVADFFLSGENSSFPSFPLADFTIRFQEGYDSLGALASSDHFTVSVEFVPRSFRQGYVFRILLQPQPNVAFKRIHQNYFFLIDRSNSVPRLRYALNKRAVSYALDYLLPGDTFNILIFDDRVVRFSSTTTPWTQENVQRARAFLDAQGHGGVFAATELYASLGKIIPQDVSDQEVNTAILLSDGDTYLTLEKQRQTIGGWTATNRGKVSLFCLASGTGNNLSLLELISNFNKGALIYTPQHHFVQERLCQLIVSLQTPIGKDLVATVVPVDKQATIILQPKNIRLPHLYQRRTYTIWGTTNRLTDFTLFLQGKYYDRVFDIKKKISFKEAQNGTLMLERQWAEIAAQEFYESFFRDGRRSHLEQAKKFLSPLNLLCPFEKQLL